MKFAIVPFGVLFFGANAFVPTQLGHHRLVVPQQQQKSTLHKQPLFATIPAKDEKKEVDSKSNTKPSPKILTQPIPYEELTIGVTKETYPGENRVSQTPDSVRGLVKAGFKVVVQSGGTQYRFFERVSPFCCAFGHRLTHSLFTLPSVL
jgi:hypothetical protein